MKDTTWVISNLGDTWRLQPQSAELDVDLDLIGYYFIAFVLAADGSAIWNDAPLGAFLIGDDL
jgi:hypothetical protein